MRSILSRRRSTAALLLTICAVVVAVAATPAAAENWSASGSDAAQNPLAASEPGRDLGTLWRGPVSASSPACTAVADGRVFAVVASDANPNEFRVSAVSATSGATLWTSGAFTSSASLACAAVEGQRVFVATRDGVNAYSVQDGSALWTHQEPGFSPSGPPAAEGGGVYLSGAGGHTVEFGEHLALDAATGNRRWIIDGSQTETPPVVVDGVVIQGHRSTQGIAGYAPTTGATIWNDPTAWGWPRPVGDGGTIFYQSGTNLVARQPASGTVEWQWPIPQGQYIASLVADASRLYARISFMDGNLLGRVIAIDRTTGTVAWNKPSANITDQRLMRLGRSLLSLGYSGGAAFDPQTGAAQPLDGLFAWIDGASYADSTFYAWRNDYSAGTWTLEAYRDVTAPQLSVDGPADGLATADPRPAFVWSVGDGAGVGVADVTLNISGRAPIALGAAGGSYRPDSLADGNYRFTLTATDAVGNRVTSATRVVTVDTQTPDAVAIEAPSGTVADPRPGLAWGAASDATSGVESYAVTLDGAAAGTVAAGDCAAGTCRLTPAGTLADGPHTWSVTAVDRAGNRRLTDAGSFTVAVAPTGALQAPAAPVYAGDDVRLQAAFTDRNDAGLSYRFDLDGDGSHETAAGASAAVTTHFDTVGTHNVGVLVSDAAGHSASATATVVTRLRPAPGELGVSINGGDIATNSRDVQLTVVWPAFAADALISNDGGFGAAGSTALVPVAQAIPWRLATSGPERLPKTVYVRFKGGDAGRETYTDDIILDERAPVLAAASASAARAAGSVRVARAAKTALRNLRVRARDDNSGIGAVQVSARRSPRGAVTKRIVAHTKRGKRAYTARLRMRVPAGRVWVRVLDAAGNASAWRRAG
jgi:hypothetical protein